MIEQIFAIGRERLRLLTNNPEIIDGMCQWVEPVAATATTSGRKYYVFSVENDSFPIQIPGEAQLFHSGTGLQYFLYKHLWLIDCQEKGRFVMDLAGGSVLGFLRARYLASEGAWFSPLLGQILYELLRREEIYKAHAAGVSCAGQGVLLAGDSRSGKSTLGLRLVGQGFGFLADDRCFLARRGDGFEVLASPEAARVYPPNVADLPEFHFLHDRKTGDDGKTSFRIGDVYPGSQVESAELKVIIFPSWLTEGETRVEALSAGEALRLLIPVTLEPFFPELVFPETVRAYFRLNPDLATRTPCFRMYLGHDKETWARFVREMIA